MRSLLAALMILLALSVSARADTFSTQMKVVGEAKYGQPMPVTYHNPAKYRAVTFTANQGDKIAVHVQSNNGGDPVLWLTDASFRIIAANDDATDTTVDSYVALSIPASGKYYAIFREYYGSDAGFNVLVSRDTRRPLFAPLLKPRLKHGPVPP